MGGGFKNTEWLATIDNNGEVLILHSRDSVQLIPLSAVRESRARYGDWVDDDVMNSDEQEM